MFITPILPFILRYKLRGLVIIFVGYLANPNPKGKLMKIRIVVLLLAATFSNLTKAQKSCAILRGGVNLANISITDNGKVDRARMLTTFQVGIAGDIRIAGIFYIQPGLLFTGKGAKSEWGDPSGLNYSRATTHPFYLELPLNFILKTPVINGDRFFIGAGPYMAMGIAGKLKNEGRVAGVDYSNEENIEFSDDDPTTLEYEEGAGFGIIKRFDHGINGTIGVESKSIVLSVNCGWGLAKLQSGASSSADESNKHRTISILLGIKL